MSLPRLCHRHRCACSDFHRIGQPGRLSNGLRRRAWEVSTHEINVMEGDKLKKVNDLGSFHFADSTYCLVLRLKTPLKPILHVPKPGTVQNVNSNIFYIEDRTGKY
ncbi:hypothetical protein EV401DRAFT_1990446 [Pisolithus croceorrhizus]|nr:hypothetical protein EV401DRAFT_1990446 [Pisolithus croceorrhizus]